MRARVDRVRYQKPLVGRVFPCSLSKTLGIVVTVVALKNPGADRVRSQKPWWGFSAGRVLSQKPGSGVFVTVCALKKPGSGVCVERVRSQKPW